MNDPSNFSYKVIHLIQKVPRGKVATYGQIAKLAGKPQGSRGVAWILHSSSKIYNLPWQRVVNAQGRISFPEGSAEFKKQKRLLAQEGIEFNDKNEIDLQIFQWNKKPESVTRKSRTPRIFS